MSTDAWTQLMQDDGDGLRYPAVVVTCGRSRVHGHLMSEDARAWYVRHENAPFAKQYRKDEWSLSSDTGPGGAP